MIKNCDKDMYSGLFIQILKLGFDLKIYNLF